jgi:hypothetical protein
VEAGGDVTGTGVLANVGTISVGVGLGRLTRVAVGTGAGAAPMSDPSKFREVLPHFFRG